MSENTYEIRDANGRPVGAVHKMAEGIWLPIRNGRPQTVVTTEAEARAAAGDASAAIPEGETPERDQAVAAPPDVHRPDRRPLGERRRALAEGNQPRANDGPLMDRRPLAERLRDRGGR